MEFYSPYIEYSKENPKKIINKIGNICFSSQFRDFFDFDLYVYLNKLQKYNLDHNVILNNKDINLFLRVLKKEFGGITYYTVRHNVKLMSHYYSHLNKKLPFNKNFDVKLIKIKYNECKSTDYVSKNLTYKLLCTYLRYLYEKPFNEMLKKALDAYKKDKSIHLFTYLYYCHNRDIYHSYNSVHSIIRSVDFCTKISFTPINKINKPIFTGVQDFVLYCKKSLITKEDINKIKNLYNG